MGKVRAEVFRGSVRPVDVGEKLEYQREQVGEEKRGQHRAEPVQAGDDEGDDAAEEDLDDGAVKDV